MNEYKAIEAVKTMTTMQKAFVYRTYVLNFLYRKYDNPSFVKREDFQPMTYEQFVDSNNIQINVIPPVVWKQRGFASQAWVVLNAGSIYHSISHGIKLDTEPN